MERKSKARMVALYGMLIALAFVLSYIEAMMPFSFVTPGIKLGLANLVTVVGLYTVGYRGTVVVSLVRILLVGFTFSNVSTMMYSLAGGILSLAVMMLAKKYDWFSPLGVSVLGGVFHNVGQLALYALVTETPALFAYLPALMFGGVTAGILIGIMGGIMVARIGTIVKK